jgi:PAS domain S-box-containing protein
MSLKDIDEKKFDDREKGLVNPDVGNKTATPDRKLLLGKVRFFEDILLALPDTLIVIFNRDGKYIEVWGSPGFTNISNLSPENIKGKLLKDIYSKTVAALLQKNIEKVFDTKKPDMFRLQLDSSMGINWQEVYLSLLPVQDGDASTIVGVFRNITEIVKREEKFKTSLEKFENIFENAPEGLALLNAKGVINYVNSTLLEISGFELSDFLGKKFSKLPILLPEDYSGYENILDTIIKNRAKEVFELEWKTKDGKTRWTELHFVPVIRSGRFSGFNITFIDITERKIIEGDLIKSKQAYKIIIENAREAIFVLQDSHIKFCNSRMLELVDSSMNELELALINEFIHPHDYRIFNNAVSDKFSGSTGEEKTVFRIIDKSGDIKWVESNFVVIDWEGTPALLSFTRDITSQKYSREKEKQHLKSLELLSEKSLEFAELKPGDDVYRFLGEKLLNLVEGSVVVILSYDQKTNRIKIEHLAGEGILKVKFEKIISEKYTNFGTKVNPALVRDLLYGKLLKYNDGLFELGNTIFPRAIYEEVKNLDELGDIYMIGLASEKVVFGNVMIFLPLGGQIDNSETIETIIKFGSIALQRNLVEDALRASEEKYRRIFESYQDVYFKLDIDGTIAQISPSVEKTGGYTPNELRGEPVDKLYADTSELTAINRILFKYGLIRDRDIKLLKKDNSVIFASLNAKLLRGESGRPVGIEGVIRDITERIKAEDDFKKSEEKLRTLADFTYNWEYWLDPEGKMVYMSPSSERITGYRAEEFMESSDLLIDTTHPDDLSSFKEHLIDENNLDGVLELDYRIVTRQNKVKWINHICQKVYGDDGRYLGRRVSNKDITDGKIAEEELRNSEERFRALFYEAPDAIIVQDYKGKILDANPAAGQLYQMGNDKLTGKTIFEFVPEESRSEFRTDFSMWVEGKMDIKRSFILTTTSKSIPVEIHASRIRYSGNDALMFNIRDITAIIESENKLKEAKENAEQADMLKSVFLANMSHEIRTPMNAIIGFSEILSDEELSKHEREEFIRYITQGSNTLMNLIEDIIDITKIEAGKIKINLTECNVSNLMDELYATFLKIKNRDGKKSMELRLNKPVSDKDFSISTDPNRIRQVLSNLLGNALKFTDEGYIELGFTLERENQVVFYVKDTGIGIPKEKQKLIFERFGQVEDAQNKEQKGTGLGLAISKKLAELLGGNLTVESEKNVGSIFKLTLPVNLAAGKVEKKKIEIKVPEINWNNKVILIAEDSVLNYTYLEAILQRTNVKLLWAKDGKEAVEMCQENDDIDIVLMDIKMPVLDGLNAIKEIKKFRKELPIIVQTAYAMPEDRERSFAAGSDDYLTKPLNATVLFKTISKFMN